MKKYLILTLMLSACATAKPYTCQFPKVDMPGLGSNAAFCIANTDIDYILTNGYNDAFFNEFGLYAINNFDNGSGCGFTHNVSNKDYMALKNGTRIDNDVRIYTCNAGAVQKYEKQRQLETEEKTKQEEIKRTEKKLGKKLCTEDELSWEFTKKNCAFALQGYDYQSFQQTSDGTIMARIHQHPAFASTNAIFIAKNKTDSALVDEKRMPGGYFENIGSYSYKNVSGGLKTLIKLKRLSGPELLPKQNNDY